jgi:hypothetical protein
MYYENIVARFEWRSPATEVNTYCQRELALKVSQLATFPVW